MEDVIPDICMCPSRLCTVRSTCYRHTDSGTKPAQYRQSFFMNAPGENFNCVYYWPVGHIKDLKGHDFE